MNNLERAHSLLTRAAISLGGALESERGDNVVRLAGRAYQLTSWAQILITRAVTEDDVREWSKAPAPVEDVSE